MWSLPELPEDASGEPVADAVRRRFGLDARTSVELPAFEHAFTHFRLRATPVCVDVAGAARVADGAIGPGTAGEIDALRVVLRESPVAWAAFEGPLR